MSDSIIKTPMPKRLFVPCYHGLFAGLKSAFLIACVMVPVSLAVLFLNHLGVLSLVSAIMTPFMKLIGLSGKASLVFLASILFNIYGAIAVINVFPLTLHEITILSLMCLLAHNLVIETALMKKTKSSAFKMVIIRLTAACALAWVLNLLVPGKSVTTLVTGIDLEQESFLGSLPIWGVSMGILLLKITLLVVCIKIGQKLMEEFKLLAYLSRLLSPFMKIFGLARENTDLWVVMNAVSYASCAALVSTRIKSGTMKPQEADLLNHHASMMHSLVKDTLPFMLIGVALFWLVIPRFIMALCLVWIERIRRSMFKRSFRIGTK